MEDFPFLVEGFSRGEEIQKGTREKEGCRRSFWWEEG